MTIYDIHCVAQECSCIGAQGFGVKEREKRKRENVGTCSFLIDSGQGKEEGYADKKENFVHARHAVL